MSLRAEELKVLASKSAFFDDGSQMYRMQITEDDKFLVLDEDSGEEYWIQFDEVGEGSKFYFLCGVEV